MSSPEKRNDYPCGTNIHCVLRKVLKRVGESVATTPMAQEFYAKAVNRILSEECPEYVARNTIE